jgi:glycosyltransferase involved in cell wall biosynthesis
MKIAIDYRPLQSSYANHGIGVFLRNIFTRLGRSRLAGSIVYIGRSGQEFDAAPSGYRTVYRPTIKPWFWEQLLWPVNLRHMRADIFHSTVSLGPLREIGFPYWCPVPSIATVYDLNSLKVSQLAAASRTRSFRVQKAAMQKATRVVTISNFVKNDLVATLGIDEKKIVVLPCAVDDAVRTIFDGRTFGKVPLSMSFILAMGETENKNIVTAIRVFERLAAAGFEGALCVVGQFDRQTPRVKRTWKNSRYQNRILFLGELSPHLLVSYYAACEFFLFPSIAEGFGLPILEAMYCGAPVITSNTTALPEAAGEAAILLPPSDIKGMTAAATQLLHDWNHRSGFVRKGYEHARVRSWDTAVGRLVSLYEELGQKNH